METSGRLWVPLLLLILAISAIYTYRYLDMVDRANASMLSARSQVTEAQELLSLRRREHDELKTKTDDATNKLRQAQTRLDAAQKLMDAANQKERALDGELKYLLNSLPDAIRKVRDASAPDPIAEVRLKDGKVLRNAVIKKVQENEVSLFHSDGYSTVPASNLPNELVETYDLGPTGMVNELRSLSDLAKQTGTQPADKPAVTASSSASSSPPPNTSLDAKMIDDKAKKLRGRLDTMAGELSALQSSISAYEAQANTNNAAAENARSRGTPSTKYTQAAQAASKQAQALKAKFVQMEADRRKVETELMSLTAPK